MERRVEQNDVKLQKNRELIFRALTDPKFRRLLKEDPQSALGLKEISALNEREIENVFNIVREIDARIGRLADQLLCANDGPCGIG